MWSWWASIESVSKFYTIMQVSIVVFGFLTLVASGLSIKASQRISSLQALKDEETSKRIEIAESSAKTASKSAEDIAKDLASAEQKRKAAEKALQALQVESKKLKRGISSSYDFNGVKRENTAGGTTATVGEETSVFQNLINLEKSKKFGEIIPLCEKQIVKTPEWLTPYLFLGIAYANIGNINKAIENLEYVIDNAPGDPQYAKAGEILKSIKK